MTLPSFPPKAEEFFPGEPLKEPPLPRFLLKSNPGIFEGLPPAAILGIMAGIFSLAAALAVYRETKGEV